MFIYFSLWNINIWNLSVNLCITRYVKQTQHFRIMKFQTLQTSYSESESTSCRLCWLLEQSLESSELTRTLPLVSCVWWEPWPEALNSLSMKDLLECSCISLWLWPRLWVFFAPCECSLGICALWKLTSERDVFRLPLEQRWVIAI